VAPDPLGDWQVSTDVVVDVVVGGGAAAPASMVIAMGWAPPVMTSLHVNGNGQSLSVAHGLFLDWQVPGNEVVVTQLLVAPASTAMGGTAVPLPPPTPDEPPPDETVPPLALPDEAEHVPRVSGWQTKPSPHSESALHDL
jgi:hypothetical protein